MYRPPVDPFASVFVYVFALAPPIVLSLIAALYGSNQVAGGDGLALLLSGLAVIIFAGDLIHLRRQQVLRTVWLIVMIAPAVFVLGLALIQPWTGGSEVKTALPANAVGKFFGENFERRVGLGIAPLDLGEEQGGCFALHGHVVLASEPDDFRK